MKICIHKSGNQYCVYEEDGKDYDWQKNYYFNPDSCEFQRFASWHTNLFYILDILRIMKKEFTVVKMIEA